MSAQERRYEREQAELHWNCPFFRHCWNEGLKLPTRRNYQGCSNQYQEFKKSQANCRSIHERLSFQSNDMDWRIKNKRSSWSARQACIWSELGRSWWRERVCLARRPMVSRRSNKEPEKKSSTIEEQRIVTFVFIIYPYDVVWKIKKMNFKCENFKQNLWDFNDFVWENCQLQGCRSLQHIQL